MTVGDSGIGKTSLGLTEAVGLALGRDLLGSEQIKPYKVWYHNGEDTRDEINLRLGAICRHYSLDQAEVQKNLFITCGLDMPVQVAAGGPPIIDKKLVQNITDAIVGEEIDVAIFDPLVTMHGVNENSTEIRAVLREVFARIGNFTGCAIEIAHHTRKLFPGQTESTGSDVRGSTEIKAAVRGMRTVNVMSKTEAELYEIAEEDRLSYFKTIRDKANMARRGQICWHRIVEHELPNGNPQEGVPGETVGVVEAWTPPSPVEPRGMYSSEDKKFWLDLVTKDGRYRYHRSSGDWFGHQIIKRLGMDPKNTKHEKITAAILEDLIGEGFFRKEERPDRNGRMRMFVSPGDVSEVVDE